MILNIIYFILIIFLIFIISIFANRLLYSESKNNNLSILFLTDYNKNIINCTKKYGQSIYYNFILTRFLEKNYPNIKFNIYLKALHNNTDINDFVKFIHKNNIKIIISTEMSNSYLLSKYKSHIRKINAFFMENVDIYEILDDKYKLKYFCKSNNILYPKTISVSDRSINEIYRFINDNKKNIFLKKKNNTLGGYGVYDLENMNINSRKINSKINSDDWLIQKKINGVFVGTDVLYINGKINAITFHKNKNYKKMFKGFSNYYYPSLDNIYSHNGLRMNEYFYVNNFIKIIKKIGKSSQYNGIMNIDFIYKLKNNKIKIYLLEINPRIGGSIHISSYSGLLKSYFDYLIYRKINKKIIKYKNIEIEKWSNHRYTTLIPFIFDNMDVVLNINNLKNNSKIISLQ